MPYHLAIIMDGNGRWAKKRMLPRFAGHNYGAKAVEKIVLACKKLGLTYVTLFAFSTENWQRPQDEINNLFDLLRSYLKKELKKLIDEGIKLNFIGNISKFPVDIQQLIDEACKASIHGEMTLTIALSYGGRDDINNAAISFAKEARCHDRELSSEDFAKHLSTYNLPDPDLLIRTGGEYRISNFMLWQLAYTELYFCDTLWPDFNEDDLNKAIEVYKQRERRYGR